VEMQPKNREKKYDAITNYLLNNGGSQVTLTFTQFDELLFPHTQLPKSARVNKKWWLNDYKYSENNSYGWLNAGYEVAYINVKKEYVVFNKLLRSSVFVKESDN